VALGISGSIQHVVGLKNAEYVIAVNSNKHAPICSLSDIVVEGDAREFIPRMVARIEQSARTDIKARQGEER
jgi:electron transfer flavoprotein alpha subunit